jgi:hypothetical protein
MTNVALGDRDEAPNMVSPAMVHSLKDKSVD